MAKEGLGFIITIVLFSLVLTLGSWVSGKILLTIFMVISWIFVIFSFYFFRDPSREIPQDKNAIVSPADGKIVLIEETFEPDFFKEKVTKVSIFLSIFDVHINRIPFDGQVTFFDYRRGKFLPAFKSDASFENEQSVIGIENPRCKILFKQIAGILARRIVCHVREGQQVKKGERFGMIKFGSRTDIFLPLNVKINVKLNEHVKGGESIIGLIDEK